MKRTLLLFLVLFAANIFSQVELSTRFQRLMENTGNNEYVRAIVYLHDQVDLIALDQELYAKNATLQERAYTVITALQRKADQTQGRLKNYFQEKMAAGDIFDFQPFWIVNAFMVEAKPSVFNELMFAMDVAEIDIDARTELEPYVIEKLDVEGTESVEPGIQIVNAHLLWAMGITGQGRLVMSEDTGVLQSHPALSHKWRGNTVPASWAWWDAAGTTTPSDCDGHGTHTTGTMVGRSLTTADTVGIAIDAEWIAAKTICSGNSTTNHFNAYQWAMNPDGNPNTINDMPDAINNSWYDPSATDQCTGAYIQIFNALEAAGIAVVFSAGNNGPGVSTITPPKNINTNDVNVFSVANINGATYLGGSNNPITSSSSRGPSVCGGTGSLLIKPEVSAPGTSVRSSYGNGGYSSLTGTSMAAPHVAGAVALLKQAFPTLTGKQILLALYNTSKDLGEVGEDNTYGKGLIDIYAAFLSLGTPDSVPPTAITNLSVHTPTSNSLSLSWTVPFDTSQGGIKGYDIRYSLSPITDTTAFNNATVVPFTGVPDTIGATETIVVSGLNPSTVYYFSVKSRDVWGNWSSISNNAFGSTLGAPTISVNPTSISHVVYSAQTITDTVWISNNAPHASTLNYNVAFENNTFPGNKVSVGIISINNLDSENNSVNYKDNPKDIPGQSIEGQGGPDAFGYKWIDSNEPNGPQYVWEDIVATGTQITNWVASGSGTALDDGHVQLTLPFGFKFYGNVYNSVYVSTNGFLTFDPITAAWFTNASIPTAAVPNNLICPFWDDLDGRTQGTVHYKADGNRFIIQYTNWQKYSGTGSLTFQVQLYQSGKIMFYYNNMNATLNSATVGIENGQGTVGLQVVYNANYVANNLAVKFAAEPDWLSGNNLSGTLHQNNTVGVILSFSSEDFPLGNYSMDMKITSNASNSNQIIVPISMAIQAIPVELTAFTAEVQRSSVLLSWRTSTETNNRGFAVERKVNNEWKEVGFINGKGTTTSTSEYKFVDNNLTNGTYSYRLKQLDFDGTYEYSYEVFADVTSPTEFWLGQNYPNPFNPTTTIEFAIPVKSDVSLIIYSSLGEKMFEKNYGLIEAGYHQMKFDASSYPSGTYIYKLEARSNDNVFIQSKKMILIK